jgi:lysyl-tRNA synthetase class 2
MGHQLVCVSNLLHQTLLHVRDAAHISHAVCCTSHKPCCVVAAGVDFSSFQSLEEAQSAATQALEQHAADQDGSKSSSLRNIQSAASIGQILAECFEAAVESTLQQPTFVLDFPVEISPLAKPHRTKAGLVERFELYIAGACCALKYS